MKKHEMKRLIRHFDQYFEQTDSMVLHPIVDNGLHIDVLLYKPNEKYPFWKLVTMGASDYKMPEHSPTVSRFNEYILFVDPDVDLNDKQAASYYYHKLMIIATFAYENKTHITIEHSFEWKNDDPKDELIGAFILFPEIIEDVGVLRCKVGFRKTVACLQAWLMDKAELDLLMKMGPRDYWNKHLYPWDDEEEHS